MSEYSKNGVTNSAKVSATATSIDLRLAQCKFSATSISYLSPSSFSPDVNNYSMNTFLKFPVAHPIFEVMSFADIKLEVRINGSLIKTYDIPKENYGVSYLFTINASNFPVGTAALKLRAVDPSNSSNYLDYNFSIPVKDNTGGPPPID